MAAVRMRSRTLRSAHHSGGPGVLHTARHLRRRQAHHLSVRRRSAAMAVSCSAHDGSIGVLLMSKNGRSSSERRAINKLTAMNMTVKEPARVARLRLDDDASAAVWRADNEGSGARRSAQRTCRSMRPCACTSPRSRGSTNPARAESPGLASSSMVATAGRSVERQSGLERSATRTEARASAGKASHISLTVPAPGTR